MPPPPLGMSDEAGQIDNLQMQITSLKIESVTLRAEITRQARGLAEAFERGFMEGELRGLRRALILYEEAEHRVDAEDAQ